jgi:uncharacterized protein (TIGR02145 family)
MSSVNADLWDNYDGRGFAAEYSKYSVRASKDENGNPIDATYALKTSVPTFTKSTYRIPDEYESVLIGGRKYKTVTIGNQQWMAENLACPVGTENTDYCVKTANGEDLYFYSPLKVVSANEQMSDTFMSILPDGWHIPTNSEFNTLFSTIGSNSGHLKSTEVYSSSNVLGWKYHQSVSPDNASGFSLRAIARLDGGTFHANGEGAQLLSCTKSGNWYVYTASFGYSHSGMDLSAGASGFDRSAPIRLVKNIATGA